MYSFRDTLPIDISEQTISGDLVTIENPEEMGVVDSLEVSLEPIQDLNGYDKPWVGGVGKNLFDKDATDKQTGYAINPQTFAVYQTQSGNYSLSGFIPIVGDQTYKESGSTRTSDIVYYDANKSPLIGYNTKNATTAPDDAKYVRFDYWNADEAVVQFEAGSTATSYEPYSNICPISGHTECVTSVCGVNLFDKSTVASGELWSTTGIITGVTNSNRSTLIPAKPNTNYYVNWTGRASLWGVYFFDKNENYISRTFAGAESPQVITTPSGCAYIGVNIPDNQVDVASLNYPSTDHEYHAYNGTTYTTTLGQTVYGGTLDVVSGVLTVTHRILDLGTLAWAYNSNIPWLYSWTDASSRKPTPTSGVANIWSSDYKAYSRDVLISTDITGICIDAGGNVVIRDSRYTDATAFKTAMSGVQLCYELATPQTYQLTPQQIDLLLGTNHLWSDGEISVVWHKDLTKGRILPTEAVSINGQYIENVLDGYRTLYTKGRESLGAELNTYSVGTADGEKFKNKRYPARELTIGFQLIADNAEDFREKFNNLNNLLAIEEADFIFHDEEDKFFSGYPIMNAEVEAGQNSVKGEWKIYCAYPFKRSVEPITLTMADATVTNTTATFTIDYKGARPARPVLRAKFAGAKSGGTSSEDGDCGFVAFVDQEENIVQLGNPDVLDLDEYTKAETLINKEFVNVSDWTRTGGHTYKGTVTGTVSTSNAVDAFWNGGTGQTQSYAKPSYGSGSGLHGSILWKNTAGAVNFTLNAVHRLCVNNSNETGVFELGAYNHSTGKMVAGFVIDKSGNGTTGIVRYIVNGKQVGADQIDLSYYNNHFGYCNRTPVYVQQTYYDPVQQTYKVQVKTKKKKKKKKYVTKSRTVWVARTRTVQNGWNYTQSNLNSSVQKDGSYVYIQVGNLPMRTFNVSDVEQMIAHDASVFMGTYGTAMHTNMIHSLLFRREAGVPFAEQPNVFTAGDIVEADCNEATVYIYRDGSIGGHLEPQYGALGNDWEDFLLTSGTNVIRATWSDWVNPTYKPQIEIEYNEVFI